jgi:hypothetical protein
MITIYEGEGKTVLASLQEYIDQLQRYVTRSQETPGVAPSPVDSTRQIPKRRAELLYQILRQWTASDLNIPGSVAEASNELNWIIESRQMEDRSQMAAGKSSQERRAQPSDSLVTRAPAPPLPLPLQTQLLTEAKSLLCLVRQMWILSKYPLLSANTIQVARTQFVDALTELIWNYPILEPGVQHKF